MGLSNFPTVAEGGVVPALVMNTVLSLALLKNAVRSVLQLMGAFPDSSSEEDSNSGSEIRRRISITQFKSISATAVESCCCCCVCLCGFEADDEISELSCKHFFHKGCLERWFHNRHHTTCPLCRSIH